MVKKLIYISSSKLLKDIIKSAFYLAEEEILSNSLAVRRNLKKKY